MDRFLDSLFPAGGFVPHGHCYLWVASPGWLHVTSDALLAGAYYVIPLGLLYFIGKRKDLEFGWIFLCFAIFILAGGTTHLMEIWTLWHPDYWVAGCIEAITAAASVCTAVLMVKFVPAALALPSPATLAGANAHLEEEIRQRRDAEERAYILQASLEAGVAGRTAELNAANEELRRQAAERQRIEDQLRRSLREVNDLKAALDEHAIVAITDPQGKITFVNDKFCAISKYSREELLGQDHRIINSSYHSAEFIRDIWTTIGQGRVWHGEIKNRASDGSFYWVDTTIVPFLNDQGKPRQYVAIRADITERKRTEDQLRQSLREVNDLKAALDEHAIVAVTDPQGKITFVNDKFCAISKYSREELLGQDHRIINSGYHPAEFIRDIWTTIGQGRVWHGEIKNRAKDGSFYWVDTTIVPFLNEQGKPRQYVAIRADITERKRAEEEAAQLAAIVESSHDAIIGKDLHGTVTSWNAGANELFGYEASEMIGQSITRLIPPERLHEEPKILAEIERGQGVRHFETVRVRKDGSRIDLSVTVSPIRDATGRIIGASKVARDITERKKAEDTIRQLNTELEQRVIERTAELQNANKELEAFSYSVSHDLRAPLRAIDGFSQAVIEDFGPQLPAQGQRYLQTVREGAQKMGKLIDDLLTFSRLSRAPLQRQEVDTNELVGIVWNDLSSQWSGRQIDLRLGEVSKCTGDPVLLKQVWVNLLSNALKYSRQRETAVVEVGSKTGPEGIVYFVRDNGTGFDMRYAGNLFGVFQRLHRAEEYEGTGVGLALVQRIVHRHNGRIWAEAAVDQGATFYFTLEGATKI